MATADETVHPEKKIKLDSSEEEEKKMKLDSSEEDEDENPYTSDDDDFTFDMSTFDDYYPDDEFHNPEHKEQYRSYTEQLSKSEGFDLELDCCPAIGGVSRVKKDERPTVYAYAMECTRFAVRVYNKQPGNTKLEFVDITRVNAMSVNGYKFFITFLAIDTASGEQKTYQTKVYNNLIRGGYKKLLLFREKPQVVLASDGSSDS